MDREKVQAQSRQHQQQNTQPATETTSLMTQNGDNHHDIETDTKKLNDDNHHNNSSNNHDDEELMTTRIIKSIPFIFLSGFCLGIYFVSWVYSLSMTSLVQSFLFVNMGPVLINGGTWIAYFVGLHPSVPSFGATGGTLVGLLGAFVIFLGISNQPPSTSTSATTTTYPQASLAGDLVALLGAAALSVYLIVGRHVRAMPLPIYFFGLNMAAYVTSLSLSFALGENPSLSMVFGFVQFPYVWSSAYLGGGPGIGGHATLSFLVKFLSPLTVSTGMLAEPLIGALMGYVAGIQGVPGVYTWIGGFILLIGLYIIIDAEQRTAENSSSSSSTDETTVKNTQNDTSESQGSS
mmetsp:Transcript_19093/g.32693  ORF Transcript_19093/g.32693 Transcript_19093/m.32693 type:complete len:349 (-) Transcript_19093:88-1134(-)